MALNVGLLQLNFHLPGCSSLKEKRSRLAGVRDRYGRMTNVAVCESSEADALQRAQWSFVVAGADARVVGQTMDSIEREIAQQVDAVITQRTRELS